MDVGLYFDLRNPQGRRTDWKRLYSFTLEACEEADRLGIDSLWFSEHHLFDDGYLPQPLTFASAVAARTRRARIGTAVLVAPLRPAAHIAEEAAVVDLVSGGRLDLGLGTGYRPPEFDLYGASIARRYGATDARAREIRAFWDSGKLLPPPAQDRLPIWMGYQGPKGAHRAGLLGEGLLSANPELVGPYREGLTAGGHDPASARMAGALTVWPTDDPERDWPAVREHVRFQNDSYRRHMVEGTDQPAPRPVDPERIRARGITTGFHSLLLATPEEAAAKVREFVGDAPVSTVCFWASLGGMPEEMIMRQVRTVAQDLAPLLRG
ncbi:LLM class flavin-dependent oxidoreductase [Streptomyces sp. NPDC005803]|uniref:LLM class flavin-dependent oxidoreductase n=1 Tax=Streptomyces sp. NPDC005803 TaxID=3154297 RepID=UPI00341196BA